MGPRHPRLHPLLRVPWRWALRRTGRQHYWDRRSHYRYYQEALRMAREYVPEGGRVIDVGSHETELLEQLDWFRSRVALDLQWVFPRPGIEAVLADFRDYEPEGIYDLVLCLQVLEHVPEPRPFARKLLRTGRTVIISVPYRWPADDWESHVHDPVDEAKLREWTGLEPLETAIVDDGKQRLVAVYRSGLSGSSSSSTSARSRASASTTARFMRSPSRAKAA